MREPRTLQSCLDQEYPMIPCVLGRVGGWLLQSVQTRSNSEEPAVSMLVIRQRT